MYVGRIMHTDLITVSPSTSLEDASILIKKKKIDHLPVINDSGKLVGILSDRDLKQYWASPATSLSNHELNYLLQQVLVEMVMIKTVITISPGTTIERAALIMQENDINALPVMEDDHLVGIITSTDVMGVLLSAIGISDDSVRLGVMVKDSIGSLAEVSEILRKEEINIQSLFSWPEKEHNGVYQLVMRIPENDGQKAIDALNRNGYKVILKYEEEITPFLP
ncbi:CBS and ACT domain-containing protein [Desulfopila inferna]|uniref:CBS and ACT domain-containing protein n=1 Tax=Desulfopila inferna TaxID=468528 RepID=UPI001966B363|nr:CBS and ACT domain-containing protein [Desulfopila inferna]MBM9604739.1 CBS domain-containing protein [Desulfopila inferna]